MVVSASFVKPPRSASSPAEQMLKTEFAETVHNSTSVATINEKKWCIFEDFSKVRSCQKWEPIFA